MSNVSNGAGEGPSGKRGAVLVVGVGAEFGGDDSVGRYAVRRLASEGGLPAHVDVTEASGEGTVLMSLWKGYGAVFIVDAASSGAAAGTVHRFDTVEDAVPTGFFRYSTHAFGVAEALALARILDELPPRCVVYGIEGRDFAHGAPRAPEVEAAAETALARIREEIACLENVQPSGAGESPRC